MPWRATNESDKRERVEELPHGGHRRGQLRDIRADVLREVLKIAALSAALAVTTGAHRDRATRDRAANRLTGD